MLSVPIFHVNGEDPEAVVHVARLALEYRQAFARDVVIELICYRRHGHNEGDEPGFTQPLMYEKIRRRPPAHELYAAALESAGFPTAEIEARGQPLRGAARDLADAPRRCPPGLGLQRQVGEDPARGHPRMTRPPASPRSACANSATRLARIPDGFNAHPKIARLLEKRRDAILAGAGARLGHRRGPGLRHPAGRGGAGPALRPGLPARHLQPAPCGWSSTSRAASPMCRWPSSPPARRRCRSTTACSPRRRCSASSTATPWRCPRG